MRCGASESGTPRPRRINVDIACDSVICTYVEGEQTFERSAIPDIRPPSTVTSRHFSFVSIIVAGCFSLVPVQVPEVV